MRSRGCNIATRAKLGRFDFQSVLYHAQLDVFSAKPNESKSKLFHFGFTEHREICCDEFEREQRIQFSRVVRNSRHGLGNRETC